MTLKIFFVALCGCLLSGVCGLFIGYAWGREDRRDSREEGGM